MSKRLNRETAKLLSGIIMSSVAIAPMQVSAFENNSAIKKQTLMNSRAVKTGTVNADVLNVRSGAGTTYSKIGSVKRGQTVQIEGSTSNGWYKIKYNNGYGYVSATYISNVASSESTTSSATTVIYTGTTTDGLNVRSGGSTSYSKIGYLSKGTKVNIVDKLSNGWYKIKYESGYGYVSGTYVTNVVSVSSSNSNTTSSATKVVYTATVNTDSLNVRSGGSTSYSVIGKVTRGTKVEIVDKMSNGWSKIKYSSGYGYVSTTYLSNIKEVSSSNDTSTATKVTHTGVVTDGLNVRSGGSTSYSKIGYLNKGTKVNIVDKLSNGWYKIKYESGYGYVSGKYVTNVVAVSSTNDTSTATTVKYTATVNTDFLNVREGGSVSYKIIGKVYDGEKVSIVDKMSNGWSKIKYGSGYGYVNTSYLSNITSSSSSSNETVIKTGTVNADSLNVRKGSSTAYDVIGKLSRGTKVEIVKVESNGWYKIKYNGGYGYVSGAYVNVAGERKNLNNFLFVGDSFTVLLSNTIKAKNDNVYIHAKSGSMPGYWIDKVSSMPSNSNVDGVVLLIGVNGAGYESNKTDVKTLINKLSAKYPNKTIYVQKVFPVGRAFTSANPYNFNQKIASLNNVIKSHCSTVSNAKFIDTTSGFVDNDGYLIHHNGDGLHIASSYNNQFYNNIFNAVKNAEK